MILLTLVTDLLNLRHKGARQIFTATYRGNRIADYLPEECLDADGRRVLWVSLNGERVAGDAWDTALVCDGDHIGCSIPPTGAVSAVLSVATVIVSAWQIYDANRRAKIKGHHAARRAAARSKHMGDSPTYGFGGPINTVNPGTPRGVLFGIHKVAGHYLLGWPQNDGTIDLMLGISEGQVNGRIGGSTEINGKPESKYPSITIASVNGTLAQGGLGIYGGASLVGINVPSIPTGGPSAGAYFWGNGVNWGGTAGVIVVGGSSTKPTVNGTGAGKGIIDAYEVGFAINKGFTVFDRNVNGYAVFAVDVEHRTPQGGGGFTAAGTATSGVARIFGGRLQSVVMWSFRSALLAVGAYDIRITFNASSSTAIADDLFAVALSTSPVIPLVPQYLKEYREFDRTNPGLAFMGIEGLPSSAIGGVLPTVTSVWEGRRLADISSVGPPGVFTSEEFRLAIPLGYTRGQNPALVILDILRNTKYGAGEFIDVDRDLDLQSFIDARDFCDRLVSRGLEAFGPIVSGADATNAASDVVTSATVDFVSDGVRIDDTFEFTSGPNVGTFRIAAVSSGSVTLTTDTAPFTSVVLTAAAGQSFDVNNTERAALCDYYIDGVTTVWKAIEAIAQPARLSVVRSNGKIKLVPDEFSPVVQVFGAGNLDKFKSERMGDIVSTRVEVQFLDEEKDWQQASAVFEDDLVHDSTKTREVVPSQIEAYGVTRRTQALRIAKYVWLSNRLERETIEFEADATALTLEWGDVIQVVHESLPRDRLFTGADGELHHRYPSGRIREVVGTTVILDDFHTWDLAGGFDRFLVQRSDTDVIELIDLVPAAVDGLNVDRLTFPPFVGYVPQRGDIFITEASFIDDPQTTLYKVVSLTRSEEHRRKVVAVTFDQDLYLDNVSAGTTSADTIELSEIDP